jgi:hypothetical protein
MNPIERNTFNPLDWIDFDATAKPVSDSEGGSYEGDAAGDVQYVIQQIEEKKIDITEKYEHWRNIGFGLASIFGEGGRDYFHRVSCFYPRYTKAECDGQFSSCLKGKKNGITLKSFFYYAKEAGIRIVNGERSMVNSELEKGNEQMEEGDGESSQVHGITGSLVEGEADKGENTEGMVSKRVAGKGSVAESGEERLPNLPAGIYEDLPLFLKRVVAHAVSDEERDLLLLGSLGVLSSCLPTFYGIYDGKRVYANLYLFVTAMASAGKGRLSHCKQLVQPIHYYLRDQTKLLKREYDVLLAEYNQVKNSDGGEKPNRPPEKMLFIPANNSTTGVFQLLHDNEGRGMIFETEGDTLAGAFKSDYGNYSDGFRKAFHHETISYYRRTDREYVDIESPCVSTVLSGTPKQVSALIPSAENGLFSRFIFYYMNTRVVWKDVFSFSGDESMDDYFKGLGEEFFELYKQLTEQEDVQFVLTEQQQAQFNQFFTIVQDTYVSLKGIDYLATVRRLGLIAFRISMILSALRLMEHGGFVQRMVCEDRDFAVALKMTRILVKHAAKVFSELPEEEQLPKRNNRKELFFESLPKVFSRKEFLAIGLKAGIPDRSAERYMLDFCKCGMVRNEKLGQYSKVITSEL